NGMQVEVLHNTVLQPFVGYIVDQGDFYLHGFVSVDIPTASHDVTLVYTDIGIGYYLCRSQTCHCRGTTNAFGQQGGGDSNGSGSQGPYSPSWLSAVIPT